MRQIRRKPTGYYYGIPMYGTPVGDPLGWTYMYDHEGD